VGEPLGLIVTAMMALVSPIWVGPSTVTVGGCANAAEAVMMIAMTDLKKSRMAFAGPGLKDLKQSRPACGCDVVIISSCGFRGLLLGWFPPMSPFLHKASLFSRQNLEPFNGDARSGNCPRGNFPLFQRHLAVSLWLKGDTQTNHQTLPRFTQRGANAAR
jgi:hypothetical protein